MELVRKLVVAKARAKKLAFENADSDRAGKCL